MLSQTVEYALRAMVHLAALDPETATNSQSIATATKIPHGYLSKVLRDLVVAKLVTSQRGPSGGFCLARQAAKISLLEVVNAVDPLTRITQCPLGNPAHIALCPLHTRIDHAIAMIETEFEKTSLAELVQSSARDKITCRLLQRESKRR